MERHAHSSQVRHTAHYEQRGSAYQRVPQEHIVVHFRYDWMNQIWEKKAPFLAVFTVVAMLSYGALYALDFYPELTFDPRDPTAWLNSGVGNTERLGESDGVAVVPTTTTTTPSTEAVSKPTATPTVVTADSRLPVRVIIDKLDRDVKILNPQDTSIEALDTALLSGIVRHPDSADFKNTGTMFLLGHSSYLPTVRNKNFQAFNGIQKLEWGDTVRVQSSDTEYLYRVQKVYEVKASTASAEIQWEKPKLIMVTCDTFGAKEDRFVVEAYLIDSYPIKEA